MVFPNAASVLVLPSGGNESAEFPGPHAVLQPLLTGSVTCCCSSPSRSSAGLHICVEGQVIQIVKAAVVMTVITAVMMTMMVIVLLAGCFNFLLDICT